MFLDYSLKTQEERVAYINDLCNKYNPSNREKQYIADYLLFVNEKITKDERKRDHSIITKNREITINKRQISYEQIVSSLENGEDGLYTLISNDKNQILDPKDKITEDDLEEFPALQQIMDNIKLLEEKLKTAQGKNKYLIKQQIIEGWKQLYSMRSSLRGGGARKTHCNAQIKAMAHVNIPEKIYLDINKNIIVESPISILKPESVSFLLSYYSMLKQECWDDLHSDMHWLLIDLENTAEEALKDEPVLYDILKWKIDGYTNEQIQEKVEIVHGVIHNEQYYSTLWRKRIPKIIAAEAQRNWLIWHYTSEEYGEWKQCGKCGEYKPAHKAFFSRNTSSDGWYSICKECRKEKNKIEDEDEE